MFCFFWLLVGLISFDTGHNSEPLGYFKRKVKILFGIDGVGGGFKIPGGHLARKPEASLVSDPANSARRISSNAKDSIGISSGGGGGSENLHRHADVATTMIYMHGDRARGVSPLDAGALLPAMPMRIPGGAR
jgi:hypothetical protein